MTLMKTYETLTPSQKGVVKEMSDAARAALSECMIRPLNDDAAAIFDEACSVYLVECIKAASSKETGLKAGSKLTHAQIAVGTKVVVNYLEDGQVHTVSEVQVLSAKLTYKVNGVSYTGGWDNISVCHVPTAEQFKRNQGD